MFIAVLMLNSLLAVGFLAAGIPKLARTPAALHESGWRWVEDYRDTTVKAIGAIEVLGAVGLVTPLASGIAPMLSPVAAVCLALHMGAAISMHVRRGERFLGAFTLGLTAAASAVLGFLVVL